jgi:xanthine/uracil permease
MDKKYEIDARPPWPALLLYGLQWWAVLMPCVIIMGGIGARLHYPDSGDQIWYMQKLFALVGAASVIQVLAGHRLPLVIGPAAVLLVGLTASLSAGPDAAYSAIFVGGALLTLLGFSNLFSRIRFLFTPRIVAVILVLIALTLSPTILRLIAGEGAGVKGFCFALAMVFALVLLNHKLRGVMKSLTVLIGIAGGSVLYWLFMDKFQLPSFTASASPPPAWGIALELEPGLLLAFIFCFFALAINEIGSIEAVGQMLKAKGMAGRLKRGAGITGVTNMASGLLGVIGPVDFSLSAGVIAATGCASRFTLVPAGLGLLACAFFPAVIRILLMLPGPVVGALLFYLMASQLASGLIMLNAEKNVSEFNRAIIVALPLMIALLVSFAPSAIFEAFPLILQPLLSNGFVMGTMAVIILEHGILRGP